MPERYEGHARNTSASDLEPAFRGSKVDRVEEGRCEQVEVRIVGQNGPPAARAAPAHHPGIASPARFPCADASAGERSLPARLR